MPSLRLRSRSRRLLARPYTPGATAAGTLFAEVAVALDFPLLTDFNRQVVPVYKGYYEEVAGLEQVGKRAVFVVDRNGIVRYKWMAGQPGDLPNVDEVLQAVDSLRE